MADALAARASWAPVAAAEEFDMAQVVGFSGMSSHGGPSMTAISSWIKERVSLEVAKHGRSQTCLHVSGNGSSNDVSARIDEPRVEVFEEISKRPKAKEERLVAAKSTVTDIGHVVRHAGSELHPSCWVTACGWKFANSEYEKSMGDVNCTTKGCKAAIRQMGGSPGSAGGADPGGLDSSQCGRLPSQPTEKKKG